MCMDVLLVHVLCTIFPCRLGDFRFLGTGITYGYELTYGCWELNLGPLGGGDS